MSTLRGERTALRPGHLTLAACCMLLIAAAIVLAPRTVLAPDSSDEPGHASVQSAAPAAEPARSTKRFASDAELAREREAGLALAAGGDQALALERLVPVYQARPDDAVALAIAEASLAGRDFKTAQVVLTALHAPDAPEALRVRGMLHEQANDLPKALALYERAIPGLTPPFQTQESRARVLSWLGRFDEASAAYAALAGDESVDLALRRSSRVRVAELAAWQKDLDGALQQLLALLAEDPKHTEALLLQGQILEWQGRYADAKRSYSAILAFDAANAEARLRLDKLLWVH